MSLRTSGSVALPERLARVSAVVDDTRGLTDLRMANLIRLVDAVLDCGALSRSELARRAGLSIPTVHRLVSELCELGLLAELEQPGEARLGRPPIVYEVRRRTLMVAGADVGNETTRCALIDPHGCVVATLSLPTRECGSDLPGWLTTLVKRLLRDAAVPLPELLAFGVGISSAVDPLDGVLRDPPLHSQWDGLPLEAQLRRALRCELVVHQDDHLAALAECSEIGTAPGATPLVVLAVGKGIGIGITLDGRTIVGSGGRLGRVAGWPVSTVAPGSPTPPILGHAIVGDGLVSAYRASGGCADVYDGASLAVAARGGDDVAREVVGWAAGEIAEVLHRVCTLIDPQAVVLGGGFAAGSFDLLLPGLRERVGSAVDLLAPSVLGTGAVLSGCLLAAERAAEPHLRDRIEAKSRSPKGATTVA